MPDPILLLAAKQRVFGAHAADREKRELPRVKRSCPSLRLRAAGASPVATYLPARRTAAIDAAQSLRRQERFTAPRSFPHDGIPDVDLAAFDHLGEHAARPVRIECRLQSGMRFLHLPARTRLAIDAQPRRSDDEDAAARAFEIDS